MTIHNAAVFVKCSCKVLSEICTEIEKVARSSYLDNEELTEYLKFSRMIMETILYHS